MDNSRVEIIDLVVDRSGEGPLRQQIYSQIRERILSGRLAPGECLPSSRVLARQIGCGRNTVLDVYEQLTMEGYLEARSGSGTFVSMVIPDHLLVARYAAPEARAVSPSTMRLSNTGERLAALGTPSLDSRFPAFAEGMTDTSSFPFDIWSRIHNRLMRNPRVDLVRAGDPAGYAPLRAAIAAHLRAARGLSGVAEQVIITSGGGHALDLLGRLLLDHGDQLWIEEPGYPGWRRLAAAGAELVPVPVDHEGLVVASGRRLAPQAKMAVVTPSHQFPLGHIMSLPRRLELLGWARETGAILIEDDYNCEIRYEGPPLSALQSLDNHGSVVYVGTFSKALFPALRIGYMVVPLHLVDAIRRARVFLDYYTGVPYQAVLARFIEEGHFEAHIRRVRKLYQHRREQLVALLDAHLGDRTEVVPGVGGMHLLLRFRPGYAPALTDEEVSLRARARGITARPLSGYYTHPTAERGLILGFGGIADAQLPEAVARLATSFEPSGPC